MGRAIGPRKVHRYSAEFKVTAVKLSGVPGVQVQTVAAALDIHPFMLSRWRKEVRDGVLTGRAKRADLAPRPARELQRLQALARAHAHKALSRQSGPAWVLHEYSEPPTRSAGDGPGSSLGRRHYVPQRGGRLTLPRGRHGPLLAEDHRLKPRRPQGRTPDPGGTDPGGVQSAAAIGRHLSYRPGHRVCGLRISAPAGGAGLRPEHEPARDRPRQRAHGAVLSLDEDRCGPWRPVRERRRSRPAPAQLYSVRQRRAATLRHWLPRAG